MTTRNSIDHSPDLKHALETHKKAVEAFLGFAATSPCHEDVEPLLELLAAFMGDSFDHLYPQLLRFAYPESVL